MRILCIRYVFCVFLNFCFYFLHCVRVYVCLCITWEMHVLAYAEQSDIIKTNNSLRNQQSQGLAPSGTKFNNHFTCFPNTKVQILTPEELLSAARTAAAAPVPYCNYVQQRACGPAAGAHTHTHTHTSVLHEQQQLLQYHIATMHNIELAVQTQVSTSIQP